MPLYDCIVTYKTVNYQRYTSFQECRMMKLDISLLFALWRSFLTSASETCIHRISGP